jgi:RNA polymerase sigma-70 factor (ECF subfamily)
MLDSQEFSAQLVHQMPALRRRAVSLSRDRTRSEDLVQITVLKAWEHRARFEENTCLRAWLFTILRNAFITGIRAQRHEVADTDNQFSGQVAVPPAQDDALALNQLWSLIQTLPLDQRKALLYMGADGYSQQEAAIACGCSVGTNKSRVSRARATLDLLLNGPQDQAAARPDRGMAKGGAGRSAETR